MKQYISHKIVEAAKIVAESNTVSENNNLMLTLEEGEQTLSDVQVSQEWYRKHSDDGVKSLVGGYFVRYEDGYESWSPAAAFEAGYKECGEDKDEAAGTFGWAVEQLQAGKKVARNGWNGKGMFLELQVPDEHSKMQQPYIYMSPVDGKLVPWLASQTDVLSDDWVIVE